MGTVIALAVIFLVLYGAFHRHHYRRHRRAGFGVWYSMRGPWGLRDTVSWRRR